MLIADGAFYDIYTACARDDLERLEELLDEDENIHAQQDEFGMTPIHWAARAGSIPCLKRLLELGAPPDIPNQSMRTPLHLATDRGQVEAVQLLVEAGADINAADKKGRTSLHRATYEGQPEVAELLLELGADYNLENKNGKTAFEVARKRAKYLKQRVI